MPSRANPAVWRSEPPSQPEPWPLRHERPSCAGRRHGGGRQAMPRNAADFNPAKVARLSPATPEMSRDLSGLSEASGDVVLGALVRGPREDRGGLVVFDEDAA